MKLITKQDYIDLYKIHYNLSIEVDYINKTINCSETGDLWARFNNSRYVKKYIIQGKSLIANVDYKIEGMKRLDIKVKSYWQHKTKGGRKMKFRLVKENIGRIENSNSIIYLEADNLEEVKAWIIENKAEFSRYSSFSDTVYYK